MGDLKASAMFGMMHQSSGQSGAFAQPVAGPEHQAFCDRCSSSKPGNIRGIRYRCSMCSDYDLCSTCIETAAEFHDPNHLFLRLTNTVSAQFPIIAIRSPLVHTGVSCSGCNASPITGFRYQCQQCPSVNLCEACEARGVHDVLHPRTKYAVTAAAQPQPVTTPHVVTPAAALAPPAAFGMLHHTSGMPGQFGPPSTNNNTDQPIMFGMMHQTSAMPGQFTQGAPPPPQNLFGGSGASMV